MDTSRINENNLEESAIIFFVLETSGFGPHCEILQIAMKCDNFEFNQYIYPTKQINLFASKVNGLTVKKNKLLLNGIQVPALPARDVLHQLLLFLQSFKKPCILVAHNCFGFHISFLVSKICQLSLEEDFQNVIAGFADTLKLFKKKFPERKGKGAYTFLTLAADFLSLPTEEVPTASKVVRLEMLGLILGAQEIRESVITFAAAIETL